MRRIFLLWLACLSLARASTGHEYNQVDEARVLGQKQIPVFTYKVVATYPHRADAYTEGLVMDDGVLFEGTGRYGLSSLSRLELGSGRVLTDHALEPSYFGEGVTVLGDRVYELTYTTNRGFLYRKETLEPLGAFQYPFQGWGLTHDERSLIMSDGSSALLFLDPKTLELQRYLVVQDERGPVGFLNELEYADGSVYANVWQTHYIARIDPETGRVDGWIDLAGLNPDPARLTYPLVLNGIAWNAETRHLLVTGKCWPHIWEIELVPRP